MSYWNQRTIVVRPEPEPETPTSLYIRIMESAPFSELAWALAYGLGKSTDKPQALLFAKRLAADPEAAIRYAGVIALVRLHRDGYREAEHALWTMVSDPDVRVRSRLGKELRCDDLPESARLKQALAKDPAAGVRLEATTGLYHFADTSSRETLLALTHDEDAKVRAEAISELSATEVNPPDIREFLAFLGDPAPIVRAEMVRWLGYKDEAFALPHLLALALDEDSLVRWRVVEELHQFPGDESISTLVKATSDLDPDVRASALRGLGRHRYPLRLDLLLSHVEDPSTEVRKTVAQCLESLASPELLPALEKLSEDETHPATRRSALRSLEQIPGAEAELLITRMLRDPVQMVAKAAKKILAKRAKVESIAPGTQFEIQYGREESVATRLAFHGRSSTPGKAWETFLSQVQRFDGLAHADVASSPCILVETTSGAHHCILPFGPVHWIRVEFTPDLKGHAQMGYALLNTAEVEAWSNRMLVRHFHAGKALSKRLGWFEQSASASEKTTGQRGRKKKDIM
jgi:HEAT repeat protein